MFVHVPFGIRRRLGIVASVVVLALGWDAPPPVTAQTPTPLRVILTPTDSGAQGYYAVDRGLFKKAGFDVEIGATNASAPLASAVSGGSYDIGQSSIAALAIAHDRGIPFVIIAPGAAYSSKAPVAELLVAAGSPIHTPTDLAGKTIAVLGLKGLSQLAVQAWLEQNHVASSTVKFVELTFGEMSPALAANRIDAAFVAEPALDLARQNGARIIGHPYDAVANDFLLSAWFVTRDYAAAHPDIIRRFAAVIAEASQWANAHHDESAKILEKYTKLAASPTMVRIAYADHLSAADVQPSIDLYVKFGLIEKPFPARDLLSVPAPR